MIFWRPIDSNNWLQNGPQIVLCHKIRRHSLKIPMKILTQHKFILQSSDFADSYMIPLYKIRKWYKKGVIIQTQQFPLFHMKQVGIQNH